MVALTFNPVTATSVSSLMSCRPLIHSCCDVLFCSVLSSKSDQPNRGENYPDDVELKAKKQNEVCINPKGNLCSKDHCLPESRRMNKRMRRSRQKISP